MVLSEPGAHLTSPNLPHAVGTACGLQRRQAPHSSPGSKTRGAIEVVTLRGLGGNCVRRLPVEAIAAHDQITERKLSIT